jgi:sarcosine oxidase subunit gamma
LAWTNVVLEAGAPRAKLLLLGDSGAVMKALPKSLGVPVHPNTVVRTAGLGACVWLRPNQRLLLLSGTDHALRTAARIRAANAPDAWALDAGARYVEFEVSGYGASAALNGGCSLDLREAAFPVDTCAQSRFDQIPVLLLRSSSERFEILVERPLAPHLWLWLCRAASNT